VRYVLLTRYITATVEGKERSLETYTRRVNLLGGGDSLVSSLTSFVLQALTSPAGTLAGKILFIVTVSESAAGANDRLQRIPPGAPRLVPCEALAVASYTYDLGFNSQEAGEDNIFVALNSALRKRSGPLMLLLKPYLTYLIRCFTRVMALPPVQTTCFRCVPAEDLPIILASNPSSHSISIRGFKFILFLRLPATTVF
jgi:hypothetical protein